MFELAPLALPPDYGEGIVPLADVKAWVAVEASETEFDDLLGALRDSAVDMVERYCGLILAPRTGDNALVWRAECLPSRVRLGVRPVTAVTGFDYIDSSGTAQTFDAGLLRLGLGGEVLLTAGQSWPGDIGGGIAITFEAGLEAGQCPPALLSAIKMFTAHLFANREAVQASGTIGGEIPLGFRQLCGAYRNVVI